MEKIPASVGPGLSSSPRRDAGDRCHAAVAWHPGNLNKLLPHDKTLSLLSFRPEISPCPEAWSPKRGSQTPATQKQTISASWYMGTQPSPPIEGRPSLNNTDYGATQSICPTSRTACARSIQKTNSTFSSREPTATASPTME